MALTLFKAENLVRGHETDVYSEAYQRENIYLAKYLGFIILYEQPESFAYELEVLSHRHEQLALID